MQVLRFAASDFVFHTFPAYHEGKLSQLRDFLVSNSVLCDAAKACGMHRVVRHNNEAASRPSRARHAMLADCFEAFLAALFLDRQPRALEVVKLFTETMLFMRIEFDSDQRSVNPKRRLQVVHSLSKSRRVGARPKPCFGVILLCAASTRVLVACTYHSLSKALCYAGSSLYTP